jgi:hypothetical protein
MEKEFVPHELALALKELGFDEPCLAWFSDRSIRIVGVNGCALSSLPVNSNFDGNDEFVTAPLYSQAFKWFREKYDLKSFIQPLKNDDDIDIYVFAYGIEEIEHNDLDYLIHEEAELACLKNLIEIVKQKQ